MGWTSYCRPPGSDIDHLQAELFGDGERNQILIGSTRKEGTYRVFYGAVLDHSTGKVWGLVVLQEGRGSTYARKEMSETQGPTFDNCPADILALLSPDVDSDFARGWRERCRISLLEKYR